MSDIPSPGQIYRHFKGNLYRVVTLAEHSETGEMLVIYQALYGEFRIYARPLSMFMERLDKDRYPEYAPGFRFELQKEVIASPAAGVPYGGHPQEAAVSKESAPELDEYPRKAPAAKTEGDASKGGGAAAKAEGGTSKDGGAAGRMEEEELHIDPLVLEFLDAGTYEERLNILSALHSRVTDDMINTMAIALDVEIPEGEDTEKRFEELRTCLNTFKKYESTRLR